MVHFEDFNNVLKDKTSKIRDILERQRTVETQEKTNGVQKFLTQVLRNAFKLQPLEGERKIGIYMNVYICISLYIQDENKVYLGINKLKVLEKNKCINVFKMA